MNEQRDLYHRLTTAWARGCEQGPGHPGHLLGRFLRWMVPDGGTLLAVLVFLLVQGVRAGPAAGPAQAPGPAATTVNYQGRLADALGNPLTGTYTMTFALYDAPAGGSPVWGPETHEAVEVSQGLFSVGLGSLTGGGIPPSAWYGDRYLEIAVAGEVLSPRELLRSVPIAGMALSVPRVSIVRQDDTASSRDDRVLAAGWGYIQGDDTAGLSEAVDFGFAFAEPPVVVISFLGGTDLPPATIGDFQGIDVETSKVWSVVPAAISPGGFEVQISRNSGTFPSDWYYGYSWVAIGRE